MDLPSEMPPVLATSMLSDRELELLERLAAAHDLSLADVTELIAVERRMAHMGRRHNIHQTIQADITAIAARRIAHGGQR